MDGSGWLPRTCALRALTSVRRVLPRRPLTRSSPSMTQVACLTIVTHGVATDQLLSCLRASVVSNNVNVGEPCGDRVLVVDLGNVDSLHDLLDQRLDQCARSGSTSQSGKISCSWIVQHRRAARRDVEAGCWGTMCEPLLVLGLDLRDALPCSLRVGPSGGGRRAARPDPGQATVPTPNGAAWARLTTVAPGEPLPLAVARRSPPAEPLATDSARRAGRCTS